MNRSKPNRHLEKTEKLCSEIFQKGNKYIRSFVSVENHLLYDLGKNIFTIKLMLSAIQRLKIFTCLNLRFN